MNDEKYSPLFSIETKIGKDGEIKIPEENLLSLQEKGFSEIKIVVYADPKKLAESLAFDTVLFDKIREVQSLPGSIVLDFLTSKGKLANHNFESRISF